MAYDVVNFQKEVIDASFQKPVLVDFWAPWCGPCRVLGPVLEKLAVEEADNWTLAKVNTDQNQEISVEYGIRGIPAVKLFVDGKVVNEFTGALPEHMIKKWLAEAIPSGDVLQLDAALVALESGQTQKAKEILTALLSSDPQNENARAFLAMTLTADDVPGAVELVSTVTFNELRPAQIKEWVDTLGRLFALHEDPSSLPDGTGKDTYLAAINSVVSYDWDKALELFIQVIQNDRYYDDDGARKACIAIFNVLGAENSSTKKHRRLFDMMLY